MGKALIGDLSCPFDRSCLIDSYSFCYVILKIKLTLEVSIEQKTNFLFAKFKSPGSYNILRIQKSRENSVDPDEMTHYEPPHLDLHCLQIQLISIFDA